MGVLTRLLDWLGLIPRDAPEWVDDPIVDEPVTWGRQAVELGFVVLAVILLVSVGVAVMA